jgi:hypothetical protein
VTENGCIDADFSIFCHKLNKKPGICSPGRGATPLNLEKITQNLKIAG